MSARDFCVAVLGVFWLSLSWACQEAKTTLPTHIHIPGDSVMIVVHETATYDARYSTKRGVDEAVRFAKARRIPVIYLVDESPEKYYFMEDCTPDYWVSSAGGEISFDVSADHLYVVGGHLEACMSATLHDVIYQWAKRAPKNHTITYFMDAIYSNGKLVEPSDKFYRSFNRFLSIVTYGRPGGEHWPKLSLLETMGVIRDESLQLDYLTKVLPRWDTTFPASYRIELQLDQSVKKVLRPAPGWFPPTVLFHFIDSALTLAETSPL